MTNAKYFLSFRAQTHRELLAMSHVEEMPDEEFDKDIDELQRQIDDRSSGKSKWEFDPDAWRKMPLFMDEITEKDVLENEQCAGLSAMIYDGVPPEEIAEGRKKVGNQAITRALTPDQVNPQNHARAAIYAYTEGLDAECSDSKLNAQLYANRSMANFLLGNYGRGLKDAQRAVLLDETYGKAYYRGAKCAEKINKFPIARSLIEKGLATGVDDTAKNEFAALLELVKKGEERLNAASRKERLQQRSKAAATNNILKEITSKGIKVSTRPEVSSEQWAQLSSKKPYFDEEGILHCPILFLYDEHSLTDFLQDVPTDCSIADCLEGELMPFPWDSEGRYRTLDQMTAVYIVDDGVAMPQYHEVDLHYTLFEVMRSEKYVMPCLVPCFHIIAKGSEILKRWGIEH